MNNAKTFSVALVLILAAALSGCAVFEKCSPENCATDAKITADVDDMFGQHAEFGPPGTVHVQTINGVVYLNGQVNSDMERQNAETLVLRIPNVKDVVNSLNPRSNAR
ncbi:MAG TPA: BON domain-containing protein [Steroidobacteraceae bacterium]|jgi:osmotically-inducible protein OsmY|nr:BON domain-containing protein [Steroidobacteraceae bacterium]